MLKRTLCSKSPVMPWLGYSLLVLDPLVQISAPDQVRKGYIKTSEEYSGTQRGVTPSSISFSRRDGYRLLT